MDIFKKQKWLTEDEWEGKIPNVMFILKLFHLKTGAINKS